MQFTVDGKAAFATTGGRPFDASLPAIVFIHGASFNATVWKLMTRYFAWRDRAVLALDLPGHGRSEGPALSSIETMADWVMAAMDALKVETAALVGHSMGSLVALDAAGRYPEQVTALALLGTSFPMPVSDVLLDSSGANEHVAMDLINSWGYGRRAQQGHHRMPGTWMMRGGLRILEQSQPSLLHTDLAASNAYQGGEDAAAAIRCPALAILGERDMKTPVKAGRKLAEKIAGCRTVVLPGTGHIMMDEAPDETLDALRELLG